MKREMMASFLHGVGLVAWAGLGVAQAQPAVAQMPARAPVAVAADPALPHYAAGTAVSGEIVGYAGMDSVEGMMQAWNDAFRKYHPGAHITFTQKDVAPEERIALTPDTDEVFSTDDRAFEDKYGYAPFRIRICQGAFVLKSHVSAIGVFVGKGNPISRISLAQLDAIYSDARRRGYPVAITRWGQLGLKGAWTNRPIYTYGFYWRDDVTGYFRDMVSYDAPFKLSYRIPGNGDLGRRTPAVASDLMAALAADPQGIGFANFSYQTEAVKALSLVDARGNVHPPALDEMIRGSYPLQRSIYVYVNRKPGTTLSPLVREFLRFVLSREGQDLVQKDHYLPLTPAMAAAERAKLD